MSNNIPLLRAYFFMKTNRLRKKGKIYKQAIDVMIDPVIAFYLLLFGGYVVVSFFILGDSIREYNDHFRLIENQARARLWLIFAILPIRYILQAFTKPGVVFSSAAYHLGRLPFTKAAIWFVSVIEKWLKLILLSVCIGSIIILATPISASTIFSYIFMLVLMDVLMTIPQWKLFQLSILPKFGMVGVVIVINLLRLITNSPFTLGIMLGWLTMSNLYLLRSLFKQIHWGKVIEASDHQVWNMPLIGSVSKTKFKHPKKYSIFQNSASRRKPLHYSEKAIHHRLWRIYLGKNIDLIIRTLGMLFIMLIILPFVNGWAPFLGIVIAIQAYTSVVAGFFKERFQADIVRFLPWNLQRYKQSFLKWAVYGGLILLVPVCLSLSITASPWAFFQFVFICAVFLFFYVVKVNKVIAVLAKKPYSHTNVKLLGVLFLGLVFLSGSYPPVSLSFIVVLFLLRRDFT